ncbi:MAG: DUF6632 domain-containing protein, partial [Candidatus Sulfotelmatobacter sp.]
MRRERALKVVLVVVGLIFSGLVYPLTMFVRQDPALAMMLSVYVTLGIFLLLAARDPSANRSLIAFMCCLSWKWRKRSSVKITERTYEKRAQSLHRRRKSSHPEATPL